MSSGCEKHLHVVCHFGTLGHVFKNSTLFRSTATISSFVPACRNAHLSDERPQSDGPVPLGAGQDAVAARQEAEARGAVRLLAEEAHLRLGLVQLQLLGGALSRLPGL